MLESAGGIPEKAPSNLRGKVSSLLKHKIHSYFETNNKSIPQRRNHSNHKRVRRLGIQPVIRKKHPFYGQKGSGGH
ncbi:hypothetical protein PthstB1num2_10030 [Parageobacillus thermoglucosidasius]|nr:hypothetical protein PthstB1num2_10030 [Parageobacillus thermoglucosidasius]